MKKLCLAGISDYAAANRFLEEHYVRDHNRRFARAALSEADFHRRRPAKRELDEAFHLEQERVVSLDWVVRYEGRLLQLERQSRHYAPAKSRVTVRENQTGELAVEYRGRKVAFRQIAHRPARQPAPSSVSDPRGGHRTPPPNHPSSQTYKQMHTPQVSF